MAKNRKDGGEITFQNKIVSIFTSRTTYIMSSRYSTRSDASRKRTALGDISNNTNGAKNSKGAKKALVTSTSVRPTPPVQESAKRSSFGRGKASSIPHVNIDAVDANDPQACAKYVNEIYAHFRATEGMVFIIVFLL